MVKSKLSAALESSSLGWDMGKLGGMVGCGEVLKIA
jgi:hypothetical protein